MSFELHFAAQVAKLNSLEDTTKLPEALTVLMLLEHADIDNSQRIPVLVGNDPCAAQHDALRCTVRMPEVHAGTIARHALYRMKGPECPIWVIHFSHARLYAWKRRGSEGDIYGRHS